MLYRFVVTLLWVFGFASFAGADVTIFQDNAYVLSLSVKGQITPTDLSVLQERSKLLGHRLSFSIILDSPGGDVDTALKMGRFIRGVNAGVMVPENAVCFSSCVFLLAAGATRGVVGSVGIHRPFSIEDDITTEQGQRAKYKHIEAEVKTYLKQMNISPELYDEMVRIPPSEIRLLTEDDLKRFGLSEDDPYIKEALVTKLAKKEGITKEEYYQREAKINQCVEGARAMNDTEFQACLLPLLGRDKPELAAPPPNPDYKSKPGDAFDFNSLRTK